MAKSPFLEGVRSEIRLRGYSMRTEKTYIHWIKRFIFFHQKRHPQSMGAENSLKMRSWRLIQYQRQLKQNNLVRAFKTRL